MNPDIQEMANLRFGYGCWNAPYWFIGPEEGKSLEEDIDVRLSAWLALGKPDICDCREFHCEIGVTKWHEAAPPLQPTWRRLMLLLMSAANRPVQQDFLRDYQRRKWGASSGETCVIELSGLPAHSYAASTKRRTALFNDVEYKTIRRARIEAIKSKIKAHTPKLVVMYGCSERRSWEIIADCRFSNCMTDQIGQVFRRCSTTFAFTRHPVAPAEHTDERWIAFGRKLLG